MNITVVFIFIDTCCTREYQHRPLGPNESQTDHTQTVDQLAPDVDGLGPEPGHHLVQQEGVAGAGEAVHGHAPAGEPHSVIIQLSSRASFGLSKIVVLTKKLSYDSPWIPIENSLTHKVGEVQTIANKRTPAKQIGEAKPPIINQLIHL